MFPLALSTVGASVIIGVVLLLSAIAVGFAIYTRIGSGINQHPYGDTDHQSGPEHPSELSHDITQSVRNWDHGVSDRHRKRPPRHHKT